MKNEKYSMEYAFPHYNITTFPHSLLVSLSPCLSVSLPPSLPAPSLLYGLVTRKIKVSLLTPVKSPNPLVTLEGGSLMVWEELLLRLNKEAYSG